MAPAFPPAVAVAPPATPPLPPPAPRPVPSFLPDPPGTFGPRHAERLLWRAGFGPRPGDVERLVAMGLDAAVASLVRPAGQAILSGPEPRDEDGAPLAPGDLWGHDHLSWLDRMVRSDQPLVERMTLVWHDWFATSIDKVQASLLLAQNDLLRRHALGSFAGLLRDVTVDPAMLVWLDGINNNRWNPNENYAREVMELFALGANRGAYTEQDVRECARAFTGWRAAWTDGVGHNNFRFDANHHDGGLKTIFGQTGRWRWDDVVRLCLEHPMHASFFVTKLWGYFVATPPDAATQAALGALYAGSGHQVAPVLEAIFKHPAFYEGPAMVKPPVVQVAGMLRAMGRGIDTDAWAWICQGAGQLLFWPPNVSGWDDSRWLDTATWRGRWNIATWGLLPTVIDPWNDAPYPAEEDPVAALERALDHLGRPPLTPETVDALLEFARGVVGGALAPWQRSPYRAMRQNALRMLIATSSDYQVC